MLSRIWLIIFCVPIDRNGIVVTMAVLSTNVYQDDAEFKSYADKQFREDKLFEINEKRKKVANTGHCFYTARLMLIDNEPVNAFRQKQIDRITADYKAAQESAEAQRAEENKDNKVQAPKKLIFSVQRHISQITQR